MNELWRFNFDDDLAWFNPTWSRSTSTLHAYMLYDPKKYDLVPKESYKKELAEQKKKEIERLEEQRSQIESKIKELKSS